jgi:hypothetical protein
MKNALLLFLSYLTSHATLAFVPIPKTSVVGVQSTSPIRLSISTHRRHNSALADKKNGLEEGVRNKLVTESIAPWRNLRLFLYATLGSGAAVGGFVTLTGVLAGLSGARPDLDLNTQYVNLGIDFGAAALFAILFKVDLDKGQELNERVQERVEKKKEQSKRVKAMREREARVKELLLSIQVSADGTKQSAKVGELQLGANQHVILVAGPRKACRDALVGANLLKNDFALANVLVVPYDTGTTPTEEQAAGFGERPAYETQPYVARPTGEGWEAYIAAEMQDAVEQSGEKCREEGIAVVIDKSGKVIRRGVGKVPWREIVNELTGKTEESVGFF